MRDVDPLGAVENELAENLLRPSRARLPVGGDDDVVGPEFELVPDFRIHVVIVHFARFYRPRDSGCVRHEILSPSIRTITKCDGFAARATHRNRNT